MRSNARCADALQREEDDDRPEGIVKYLPVGQVSSADHYYHFLRWDTEHRSVNSPIRVPHGGTVHQIPWHC